MFYSGYKYKHGFKYQAIIAANSICMALHGLFKGKVNNFLIVTNLGIKGRLNEVSSGQNYIKRLYIMRGIAYIGK